MTTHGREVLSGRAGLLIAKVGPALTLIGGGLTMDACPCQSATSARRLAILTAFRRATNGTSRITTATTIQANAISCNSAAT